MKVTGLTLPGYRVYEYLIVLDPHEELRHKIVEARKGFAAEFEVTTSNGSRPNLALANFMQYEMKEERLLNRLKAIALGYPPFKVELKDFSSFPSHTIFINVTSKVPIQNLVKLIRSESQRLMKLNDETKPHFMLEPYISIARKLKPWQYEKGWLKYSTQHFTGRFIADAMIVLKRAEGEKNWQIVERYEFKNLPVSTKQGELF
jgi:2'-5' RNA ligase